MMTTIHTFIIITFVCNQVSGFESASGWYHMTTRGNGMAAVACVHAIGANRRLKECEVIAVRRSL